MKFDFSQLQSIDFNDVGRWPVVLKGIVIALLCTLILVLGFWFDISGQLSNLEEITAKEKLLKDTFVKKQAKAANLDAYEQQMEDMNKSFGAMLRQLPSKTEVAELLVDISQAGLSNGLEFELFKPQDETPAEFYSELPIKLKVMGRYHEFGHFVSDVAALPRIVTLHDVSISRNTKSKRRDKNLIMEATAKTYRYLDEDEQGKKSDE